MLTEEILKKETALADLKPEQIAAIVAASKTDNDTVISANRKEWWDRLDLDIKEVFGSEKPDGVKTHENLKTLLKETKTKADKAGTTDALQKKIDALTTEKADLEKQIKDGNGDAALKSQNAKLEQQVKDKESEIATLKQGFEAEKTTITKSLETEKQRNIELELMHGFDKHIVDNGIKFNANIPETVLREILNTRTQIAIADVKPDTTEINGKQVKVLRDKNNDIIRNPKTGNPYSYGEYYASKLTDLIDTGRQQGGAGSSKENGGGKTNIDIGTAKDRDAAIEAVRHHILTVEGIPKTSPKFGERQKELVEEYKIMELPNPYEANAGN